MKWCRKKFIPKVFLLEMVGMGPGKLLTKFPQNPTWGKATRPTFCHFNRMPIILAPECPRDPGFDSGCMSDEEENLSSLQLYCQIIT